MTGMTPPQIARLVDCSLLDPDMGREEVEQGCALAARYHCASVTVKPHYIEMARRLLKDTGVKVGTVIGFPHGGMTTAVKKFEASDAIQRGAEEIDIVINLGALRDRENLAVQNDVSVVVKSARGHVVKAIIETGFLTEEELVRGCKLAEAAGASFVVTSAGFGPLDATPQDVRLMQDSCKLNAKVKAAGGINTLFTAMRLLEAGAARLGLVAAEAADPVAVCTEPEIRESVEPNRALSGAFAEAYLRYRALYPAIRSI